MPASLTVTSVAVVRAPAFSVAVTVTVVAPAFSATLAGFTPSVNPVEAVSSSVIVSSAVPAVRPAALPLSSTVSSPSAVLSLVGVNGKVAVPLVWLAAIVRVKLPTAAKSAAAADPPVTLLTVTEVAVVRAPAFSVAVTVTVVAPASSATLAGSRLRASAVEAVSSSVIVSVAVPAVRLVALPVSTTVSAPSAVLSLVGVNGKVPVPLACSAKIVSVKVLTAA